MEVKETSTCIIALYAEYVQICFGMMECIQYTQNSNNNGGDKQSPWYLSP
jgi:hypothetical protein